MLRIAVITSYFPSSTSPTNGRSVYEVLKLLSRKNVVRVFFHCSSYPPCLSPRDLAEPRANTSFTVPDLDVQVHSCPAVPLFSRPFNGLLISRVLFSGVCAFAPDVIYSIFLYPSGFCALRIGQSLNVPVVVEGVGSDLHSIGDPFSALLTRKVLRESDYLFTVSESLRQRAVQMGARSKESRTVLNGCDVHVFRPKNLQDARRKLNIEASSEVVVYVGRMDVKKGLRELVEAAAIVFSQKPDLQVYMVGYGPDEHLVQKAVTQTRTDRYVHLVPGCAFDEVADWMAAANVVTLPSYAEGCPNTVVEALACGRPVVATEVGGIPELLDSDCGYLVPPRDAGALAAALVSALNRHWDHHAISRCHCRTWESGAAERLEVFESLASSRIR